VDDQFRDYFRQRVSAYEKRLGPEGLRGFILRRLSAGDAYPQSVAEEAGRRALDAARAEAERQGLELRGDAELLILFLAQDLVAEPVAAVTPEEARDLPAIVAEDVIRVVAQSAEISSDREISAHSIIDGLSASWDQLESGRFRVWDRYRDDRDSDAGAGDDRDSDTGVGG
jgi:hypothetical protein